MYYKIERTFLTDRGGHSQPNSDRLPYMVSAESAQAAALAFITREQGNLLGPISQITGDKATATAARGGQVYVVFVERAADSIGDRKREDRDEDGPGSAP